jgi:purine-nucleoside phosphorylase
VTGPAGDTLAEEAAAKVRAVTETAPRAAIILGSGLGGAVSGIDTHTEIPYADLPGFPEPTVPGHTGRLVMGVLQRVPVAAFLGRIHFYEGHPMALVTLPARLASALGADVLIATAAVGGLEPALRPGTLVVGDDHLNFLGENPLRGWRDSGGGPVFVNHGDAYDRELAEAALEAASRAGLQATRGVYAASSGPTYETQAEIAYLRRAGATVVGMSIVPEVSAAAALGMRFVGLYCVTNAAGPGTSHEEVAEVAGGFAERLRPLIERVLAVL